MDIFFLFCRLLFVAGCAFFPSNASSTVFPFFPSQ